MFSKYGELADVYIPRDRFSGQSKNFAFVRYRNEEEADEALKCDGMDFQGSAIGVQFAKYGREPDSHVL